MRQIILRIGFGGLLKMLARLAITVLPHPQCPKREMSHRQFRINRERAVEKRLAIRRAVDAPEQVAEVSLDFGCAERRDPHLCAERDLLIERRHFGRVCAAADVVLQFLLDRREIGLKRLGEAFVSGFALRQIVDELVKLGATFAAVQQVMSQRPRLGVKKILLVGLVVIRRVVINGEESLQRQRRLLAQKSDAACDLFAQPDLPPIAGQFKRAEVFGYAFAQPNRQRNPRRMRAAADQRVDVFVKDDRIRIGVAVPRSHRDVGRVAARLKITRQVGGLALVKRFERPVRRIVFKHDDRDRN
ncbi:MAG: hypothetical protein JMDDDDMK_05607 [Acidobacteria bacterium]|nr:hypothetical protein [Acidobacteriota bacterium]